MLFSIFVLGILIKHYGSYRGRNPKSGEIVTVKPKKLPVFTVGKELKEAVNANRKRDYAESSSSIDTIIQPNNNYLASEYLLLRTLDESLWGIKYESILQSLYLLRIALPVQMLLF